MWRDAWTKIGYGVWANVLAYKVKADTSDEIDQNVSVDSTIARPRQHGGTAARS